MKSSESWNRPATQSAIFGILSGSPNAGGDVTEYPALRFRRRQQASSGFFSSLREVVSLRGNPDDFFSRPRALSVRMIGSSGSGSPDRKVCPLDLSLERVVIESLDICPSEHSFHLQPELSAKVLGH